VSEPIESCVERLRGQAARAVPLEIELASHRVDVAGALAQAFVHYRAVDRGGDAPQHWSGADAFTLVQHDCRWRIASLALGAAAK
jgi:hypothetical protein